MGATAPFFKKRQIDMVICLIGQERNLGILTLTDFLVEKIGKNNLSLFGWNYLRTDYKSLLSKIEMDSTEKTVLIKYIVPIVRFSNQGSPFPRELEDLSNIIFKVPTYREEISPQVPQVFLKGESEVIAQQIKMFYA